MKIFYINFRRESQQNPQNLESGGSPDRLETNFFWSLYKNRLSANFSALEGLFWPKFSIFGTRGVKIGQNWRWKLFVPKIPKLIRFTWNSILRSKTISAIGFRLNFDIKIFWGTFRAKVVFGHSRTKSQISWLGGSNQRSHVPFLIGHISLYYKQK